MEKQFLTKIIDGTLVENGATFDLHTGNPVVPFNAWYYPKYPRVTKIVSISHLRTALEAFIECNKNLLEEENSYLGTWLNPETKKIYVDITIRRDSLEEALTDARKISNEQGRKIVTVYNPLLKKVEYVWKDVRS